MLVEPLSEDAEGRYTITIAATPDIGDGQNLDIENLVLERYLRNPVVLWVHNSWSIPIGQTISLEREEGRLRAEFEFLPGDEFADRVRNAWDRGFLRAASIGWDQVDGRDVMLEWSIVPIPADQEALRSTHLRMIESLMEAPEDDDAGVVDTDATDDITLPVEREDEQMAEQAVSDPVDGEVKVNEDDLTMQGRLNDALIGATVARSITPTGSDAADSAESGASDDGADEVTEIDLKRAIAEAVNDALDAREQERSKAAEETADAEAAFRSAVARRSQIIEHAKSRLPDDFNPHAASDTEIMQRALGERASEDMSDEFMFGLLLGLGLQEDSAEGDAGDADASDESRQRAQQQRNEVAGNARAMDNTPPPDYYDEYSKGLSDAWKGAN